MKRSGRGRPPADEFPAAPNPILLAKRILQVGIGDPTLSTHPIGIMVARLLIGLNQYNAGIYYAWLYGKVLKERTSPRAGRLEPEIMQRYTQLINDCGPVIENVWRVSARTVHEFNLNGILIYGETPGFLDSYNWSEGDAARLRQIQSGLTRLDSVLMELQRQ